MATVDKIRNGLIDKILSIKDRDFLEALDKIISTSSTESDLVEMTKEQKTMLEMSEQDIKDGKLISQEAMDKRNLEWLNPNAKTESIDIPETHKQIVRERIKNTKQEDLKIWNEARKEFSFKD